MKTRTGIFWGTVCLATSLVAYSQTPSSPSPQSPSASPGMQRADPTVDQMQRQTDQTDMDNGAKQMMRSSDTAFAMKAAQGGLAEVKMGQLAAEKAADPDVKAFGQMMVDDHTKANEQLKAVAKAENMTLPSDIGGKNQAVYDKLTKLSGADFDKSYVKDMLKDHQDDVKEFAKESNNGKDAKIKGFATETLPTLQTHLDKVKSIQSKMSTSTSTSK